jgi:hypothetical protein
VVLPNIKETEAGGMNILAKVYSEEDAQGAVKAGANAVFCSVFAHDFQTNEVLFFLYEENSRTLRY